jgi:putative FmdB family regulatory protein
MPYYVYKCDKCGHELETIHKMNEKPEIVCIKCKSTMYKSIQPTTFSLKGECWAKDGYQPHTKIRKGAKY